MLRTRLGLRRGRTRRLGRRSCCGRLLTRSFGLCMGGGDCLCGEGLQLGTRRLRA
jgi:hypothetical protein